MDNPHIQSKLAYVAGMFDGDGNIGLGIRNINGYKAIIPSLQLNNTNPVIVNYCRGILSEVGVETNYYMKSGNGYKFKPVHSLIIRSQNRCRKALEAIGGYLIEKKSRSDLVLKFIGIRNKSSRDYSQSEWDMVDEFHSIMPDHGVIPQSISLPYFGGLIDAEGSISLSGARLRKHGQFSAILPRIRVATTNPVLAEYSRACFQSMGVNPHISTGKIASGKTKYEIAVNGLKKTKIVIEKMKDHIVGKIAQANTVLDFANYRLSLSEMGQPKKPYGEYEFGLLAKSKALNA